ncbi:hypothetical protein Tco_1364031 [Tanacetum coccineum]
MWPVVRSITFIIPPNHKPQVGRPSKKSKKSHDEIASQSCSSSKLSRKCRSVRCSKCGNLGHNRKGCRGQGGASQASARQATGARNVSSQAVGLRNALSQATSSSQPSAAPSTATGASKASSQAAGVSQPSATPSIKDEYTLWSLRMEQYLTNTDYRLWQVILNGDGPIQVKTNENGAETEVPLKTAQALLASQRERKAKIILILAIPDEYQLRFHAIKDAKTLWDAIKSRSGGNVKSKKMQKNVLKQQFENFSVSDTGGLDKA